MDKIRKILAPADLSPLSKAGLAYALDIARSSKDAEVIVYHVITVDETPYPHAVGEWVDTHLDLPQVQKLLHERKQHLASFVAENFAEFIEKLRIRQEVEIGVPYKKILEKAALEAVDMIVMCSHGRTGLLHILIGSVTEQVVRRALCPVLTVRAAKDTKAAGG
jgi:universal stress protein A